jgi:hypothetical protein
MIAGWYFGRERAVERSGRGFSPPSRVRRGGFSGLQAGYVCGGFAGGDNYRRSSVSFRQRCVVAGLILGRARTAAFGCELSVDRVDRKGLRIEVFADPVA